MSMAFLAEMLWKSAAIVAAALMLLRLLRSQAPADRANVLRVSVVVLLALPLVALAAPAVRIAVLPAEASPVFAPFEVATPSLPRPSTSSGRTDVVNSAPGEDAVRGWTWDDPAPLVAILYLGGVAMVLARLFAGLWTLRRWTAAARPVSDPRWTAAFERLRSGATDKVRLLETVECGSPLSWGFSEPVILIDRDRIAHPEDAEPILAHELAHIVRRDWLMLMLMHVATALFWFNPLVWWLEREAVQQSEEAADAHALERAEPARYAQMLLSYADYACGGVPANCMAPAEGLARRVKAILAHRVRRVSPGMRWAHAAMIGCLGIAAPISAAKLVAAQAETKPKTSIASDRWAEAAGVPVAPVTPRAPVAARAGMTPVTPTTPVTPVTPITPQTPITPTVAAVAPVARVSPVAPVARVYIREHSVRSEVLSAEEQADIQREAAEEAAQDQREAAAEARGAAREAAEEAREAAREAAEDAREALREANRSVHVSVDGRAIAVAVSQGVEEGMRNGAVGMEEGARKMREEARKLRDPAYRRQVIARQREQNWGHVPTDAELVASIPRMERGADRMVEGAQRMREGAVRAADGQRRAAEGQRRSAEGQARALAGMQRGAERMRAGADRMDAGAARMLQAAANLRKPEYRRQQIVQARTWGEERTDAEMLQQIPELERGAQDMKREAQRMREQARQMAST